MPEMFTMPFRPAYDSAGRTVPGAQAWFTLTGEDTESPVYADTGLATPLANPLPANGVGRFPRAYLDPAVTYRVRIYGADDEVGVDTPIDEYDPYTGQEQGAQGVQGANATVLQLGTVTTVAAGGSAAATLTHLGAGVYELDLDIPEGDQGLSGALSNGPYSGIVVTLNGAALDVVAGHITLARMANLAENKIIGRQTAGAGAPEALDIGAGSADAILDRAAGDARYLLQDSALFNSVFIPAGAMTSRTTNGAAAATTETTTNKIMFGTLDFDQTTNEYAQIMLAMPKRWNEGTITVQFLYMTTGTGAVIWGAQGVVISDDDVVDAAFGTAQTVTDTVSAATDLMQTSATAAITLAGTPAENDLLVLQIYRDAGAGGDTLNADAKLIGVNIGITTNADDDS
jgi:hypothetical protein